MEELSSWIFPEWKRLEKFSIHLFPEIALIRVSELTLSFSDFRCNQKCFGLSVNDCNLLMLFISNFCLQLFIVSLCLFSFFLVGIELWCKQGQFYVLGAWVHFLRVHLVKKGILCASTPKTNASFNHFLQKYAFFKIQGTRLGVIVAANKYLAGLQERHAITGAHAHTLSKGFGSKINHTHKSNFWLHVFTIYLIKIYACFHVPVFKLH